MSEKPWDDEDRMIDLLVDGELSEQRRRELLAKCDARPELWRRCALAFLESQTWGAATSSLGEPTPVVVSAELSRSRVRIEAWAFAVAAALMVGVSLGVWGASELSDGPQLVEAPKPGTEQSSPVPLAGDKTPDEASAAPVPEADSPIEVALVRLPSGPDGAERRMQLPVVHRDADAWLAANDSVVPADVRQAFQDLGYQVETRRSFKPVALPNGGQALLPIEDVQLQYVAALAYQ